MASRKRGLHRVRGAFIRTVGLRAKVQADSKDVAADDFYLFSTNEQQVTWHLT